MRVFKKSFIVLITMICILFLYNGISNVKASDKYYSEYPTYLRGTWHNKGLKWIIRKKVNITYYNKQKVATEYLKKYYKHSLTNYSDKQAQKAIYWLYAFSNKYTGNRGIIITSWYEGAKPTVIKLINHNKLKFYSFDQDSKASYLYK